MTLKRQVLLPCKPTVSLTVSNQIYRIYSVATFFKVNKNNKKDFLSTFLNTEPTNISFEM